VNVTDAHSKDHDRRAADPHFCRRAFHGNRAKVAQFPCTIRETDPNPMSKFLEAIIMLKNSAARYLGAFVLGATLLAAPHLTWADFAVSVTFAPPPLPVYEQPPIPDDGYIWTPGYWDYGPDGYFWVPGTWVAPPEVGLLWTPGYWGWVGGVFVWNAGYWGPQIGFYGGVNYGFGYVGHGYEGGYWRDRHFFYNRAVSNVGTVNIQNVYSRTIVNNTTVNSVSYNGGVGGLDARPTQQEEAAARQPHVEPTALQVQHRAAARGNRELLATVNHGTPNIAATSHAGSLSGPGVVKASSRGAAERAAAVHTAADARVESTNSRPPPVVHPSDIPKPAPFARPNTGNAQLDQQYQKEQEALNERHNQERQQLQQKQMQEHAQLAQQKSNQSQTQALEQQHQRQTQQLAERHAAERQQLNQKQRGKPESPERSRPEARRPN
jgi:YXWGXW repeat-containing protein